METLREQVRKKLAEPFGEEDYRKAEKEMKEARCCYAGAMIAEEMNKVRRNAGGALYFAENALALLNKTYFRKGVSRRYWLMSAGTEDVKARKPRKYKGFGQISRRIWLEKSPPRAAVLQALIASRRSSKARTHGSGLFPWAHWASVFQKTLDKVFYI